MDYHTENKRRAICALVMNCNICKSISYLYQKATMTEKVHDPENVVHLIITNE